MRLSLFYIFMLYRQLRRLSGISLTLYPPQRGFLQVSLRLCRQPQAFCYFPYTLPAAARLPIISQALPATSDSSFLPVTSLITSG